MTPATPKRRAFTLIELLIVVAIIAILAAIAVPNFLEAQVRSKVSRVKSDLRTFATAIESYTVDYNTPPPEAGVDPFPSLSFGPGQMGQTGIITQAITTPVAYLTNFVIPDPFLLQDGAARMDVRLFTYQAYTYRWPKRMVGQNRAPRADIFPIDNNEGNFLNGTRFKDLYGAWRMFSIGPDRSWTNSPDLAGFFSPANVGLPYDPSNGTLSQGNIVRSQKEPEQTRFLTF
jgi:prepilin-type N-terminal cleavage/methylation domain-containing protein